MFERWLPSLEPNVLLLGPRRAGKTTLLRRRYPDWKYATLDDLDYLDQAERDPKGLILSLRPEAILDEVQRAPRLTIAIKKEIDEGNLRIAMSGSSGLRLLDSAADSLAGRISIRHLPTACWGEELGPAEVRSFDANLSLPFVREAHRHLDEALRFGGFPEVLSATSDEERVELLRKYRDTYFTRDLAQLANLENATGLLAVLHHLGRSIGSTTEVSGVARASGLSHPTAKKYLSVLALSDLTYSLLGYHHGPVKRYVRASKTYFADPGILTALGIETSEGQKFENFVVGDFEKRRKLGLLPAEGLYYHRSVGGAEIDLIVELSDQVWAIEIKATRNLDRGDLRNLRDFRLAGNARRALRKFVIYRGEETTRDGDILAVPVAALWQGTPSL